MVDIQLSVFISVWLGVGLGLPIAMIVLHYLQNLIRKGGKFTNDE